jgi:spermidine synthase
VSDRRLDVGIFLVSFSVLLTELVLTRIFSVTLYYHLSFLVVSLAMLGIGASGLVVSLWPSVFRPERASVQLGAASLALALGTVISVGACFRISVPFDPGAFDALRIAALFGLCAGPFFAGGIVVSLILAHHVSRAHRLYFADLAGAAAGCLAFVPASNLLGAPTVVLMSAAVACAAAAVLAGSQARVWRSGALLAAVALAFAGAANVRYGFYDARIVKGAAQPPSLALEWNSFSRVDVPGTPEALWRPHPPIFAGFSSRLDPDALVQEAWLRYDADAATQITRFDGDLRRLAYLDYDVSSAAFHVRPPARVHVLGSGGGRDVLTALHRGATSVTGVEINPITIRLMRTRFRTFTGALYDGYPGVRIVNDDARAFLAQDDGVYDVIEASLVDTWAASAAGAYALTENSLYTVEAFQEYLAHLTPDGVAAFNRWFGDPAVESMRVVSLAAAALRRSGIDDVGAHVMVVRTDPRETNTTSLGSILIKRSAFTPDEIDRVRAWAEDMAFVVVYAPDDRARGAPQTEFHALLGPTPAKLIASYPYDLSAVTDDRPFFFSRVPLLSWLAGHLGLSDSPRARAPLGLGGRTLAIALATSALFTVVLVLVPLVLRSRRARGRGDGPIAPRGRWALYFGALGVGYMLVEIVLIQRFSAFLGRPAYALTVVLFSMLLASGAGSLLGASRSASWVAKALTILCMALTLYALGLAPVLGALRGSELWFRALFSAALIAPLGLLMGLPFPTGLRAAGAESRELVPWAWSVNGGASVLGSSLTVLVSMTYGFTPAMLLGAFAYATALAVFPRSARGGA